MIIQANIQAIQTGNQIDKIQGDKLKIQAKLSSGYRINQAADDTAGLSISEKMRSQIRGLNQALDNLEDGVSVVQVADGALEETHAILQRMNELSVKAANGTLTAADRSNIQGEMDELTEEVDRIARSTTFNEDIYPLLGGIKDVKYLPGAGTINKLNGHNIDQNLMHSNQYREGIGSLQLLADANGTTFGAGGIGGGSTGAMIRVTDANGNVASVMLHRDAVLPAVPPNPPQPNPNFTVTPNPDGSVLFQYNDGTIQFEVLQTVKEFEEIDTVNMKGNKFHDVNYTFRNTGTTHLKYDIAVAIDNFTGNFDSTPYYLNGVPKTGQMKENIPNSGDNYQIITPPVTNSGLECELITRLSGNGVADPADKFMMIGDMNNPGDPAVLWADLYSPQQTSTGSGGGLRFADEICGMWMDREAPPGGSYTTNLLQGISYKVEPSAAKDNNHPKDLWIQAGTHADSGFDIPLVDATAENLKLDKQVVLTQKGALMTIDLVKEAIDMVNGFRGMFGAYQNRMEKAINNVGNISENTQAAESSIRDTDMAKEMVNFKKSDILSQMSTAMFTHAKETPEMILQLLQSE